MIDCATYPITHRCWRSDEAVANSEIYLFEDHMIIETPFQTIFSSYSQFTDLKLVAWVNVVYTDSSTQTVMSFTSVDIDKSYAYTVSESVVSGLKALGYANAELVKNMPLREIETIISMNTLTSYTTVFNTNLNKIRLDKEGNLEAKILKRTGSSTKTAYWWDCSMEPVVYARKQLDSTLCYDLEDVNGIGEVIIDSEEFGYKYDIQKNIPTYSSHIGFYRAATFAYTSEKNTDFDSKITLNEAKRELFFESTDLDTTKQLLDTFSNVSYILPTPFENLLEVSPLRQTTTDTIKNQFVELLSKSVVYVTSDNNIEIYTTISETQHHKITGKVIDCSSKPVLAQTFPQSDLAERAVKVAVSPKHNTNRLVFAIQNDKVIMSLHAGQASSMANAIDLAMSLTYAVNKVNKQTNSGLKYTQLSCGLIIKEESYVYSFSDSGTAALGAVISGLETFKLIPYNDLTGFFSLAGINDNVIKSLCESNIAKIKNVAIIREAYGVNAAEILTTDGSQITTGVKNYYDGEVSDDFTETFFLFKPNEEDHIYITSPPITYIPTVAPTGSTDPTIGPNPTIKPTEGPNPTVDPNPTVKPTEGPNPTVDPNPTGPTPTGPTPSTAKPTTSKPTTPKPTTPRPTTSIPTYLPTYIRPTTDKPPTEAPTTPVQPPTGLKYSQNSYTIIINSEFFSGEPTYSGGKITEFTCEQDLEFYSLFLDSRTGEISGMSLGPAIKDMKFTIIGSNPSGNTQFDITLTIIPSAPKAISYSIKEIECIRSVEIDKITPKVSGTIDQYSIEPLDKFESTGLSFSISNGMISGQTSSGFDKIEFTVTATNPSGSVSTTITIYSLEYVCKSQNGWSETIGGNYVEKYCENHQTGTQKRYCSPSGKWGIIESNCIAIPPENPDNGTIYIKFDFELNNITSSSITASETANIVKVWSKLLNVTESSIIVDIKDEIRRRVLDSTTPSVKMEIQVIVPVEEQEVMNKKIIQTKNNTAVIIEEMKSTGGVLSCVNGVGIEQPVIIESKEEEVEIERSGDKDDGLSGGAVAGIVIAVVVVVLIVVIVVIMMMSKRKVSHRKSSVSKPKTHNFYV